MRTIWQICSRTIFILLAASVIVGGTWFTGNHFGSGQSGPRRGEFAQISTGTAGDSTATTTDGTFAPPAGRPRGGGHHGNAGMGATLLGMAQNAAIILVIIFIVMGIEKVIERKSSTANSVS